MNRSFSATSRHPSISHASPSSTKENSENSLYSKAQVNNQLHPRQFIFPSKDSLENIRLFQNVRRANKEISSLAYNAFCDWLNQFPDIRNYLQLEKNVNHLITPSLISFFPHAYKGGAKKYPEFIAILKELCDLQPNDTDEKKSDFLLKCRGFLETSPENIPPDFGEEIYSFLFESLENNDLNSANGLITLGFVKAYGNQIVNNGQRGINLPQETAWLNTFFTGGDIFKTGKLTILKNLATDKCLNSHQINRLFSLSITNNSPEIASICLDSDASPSNIDMQKNNNPFLFMQSTQIKLDALLQKIPDTWPPDLIEKIKHKGEFAIYMDTQKKGGASKQSLQDHYNKAIEKCPYLKSDLISGPAFKW